jgi:predicted acyltransferase
MKIRFLSLDILRGITLAGMILVNNTGNGDFTYAPLLHADWNGFTPTDLVFPSFLFMVGVAMRFSFKAFNYELTPAVRNKILKRTLYLFLINYLVFYFPFTDFSLGSLYPIVQLPSSPYRLLLNGLLGSTRVFCCRFGEFSMPSVMPDPGWISVRMPFAN